MTCTQDSQIRERAGSVTNTAKSVFSRRLSEPNTIIVMDSARRQAYFGLFDGYHCYGPLENHLPDATCLGHDNEVPN